jgi:hypothetical protein
MHGPIWQHGNRRAAHLFGASHPTTLDEASSISDELLLACSAVSTSSRVGIAPCSLEQNAARPLFATFRDRRRQQAVSRENSPIASFRYTKGN